MIILKNPFAKRKRGNRLVTSLAKKLGEKGIDKEPLILKLILGICHDTNYKIRMDGILFFKEYLSYPQVLSHQRFKTIYLSEVIELLNDEEYYIRIEAIEILAEVLHLVGADIIEKEFMPVFFSTIESTLEDITLRLAQLLGKIVFQLK
jgi:hypothetical protein